MISALMKAAKGRFFNAISELSLLTQRPQMLEYTWRGLCKILFWLQEFACKPTGLGYFYSVA